MQVFTNQTTSGLSLVFQLTKDIHKVTVDSDNYERARFTLMIEDEAGSGNYVAQPDWTINQNGSKNIVTNGATGVNVRLNLDLNGGGGTYNAFIE